MQRLTSSVMLSVGRSFSQPAWVSGVAWPACSVSQRRSVIRVCDARSCADQLGVATTIGQWLCSKGAGDGSPFPLGVWVLAFGLTCGGVSVSFLAQTKWLLLAALQALFVSSHVNGARAAEQDQLRCKNGKIRVRLISHYALVKNRWWKWQT